MPIYTKKGDKGKTSLGSGLKVWKDEDRVKAYGAVDELNASLGVVNSLLLDSKKKYSKKLSEITIHIQDDLFSIGAYLSNPANAELINGLNTRISMFEKDIDDMTKKMPELTNFTIPGGSIAAAQFHIARTIARRAERELVTLMRKEKINEYVLMYLNRLSDLLFTMNRFGNFSEKVKEVIWRRR